MFNISSYFEKFKRIEKNQIEEEKIIKDILKKNLNSDIDFLINKNIIEIKNNFSAKNSLFIKKSQIIKDLNQIFPNKFVDII